MRGPDEVTGSLFSHADHAQRMPGRDALRVIGSAGNDALRPLDADFHRPYGAKGRSSIAPGRLIHASRL